MRIENNTKYICKICGASLRTAEIAKQHEIECKKERDIKNKFESQKAKIYGGHNEYVMLILSKEQFEELNEYYYHGRDIEMMVDDEIEYPEYFHCVEYKEVTTSWEDEFTDYYVKMTPIDGKIFNIQQAMKSIVVNK